MIEALVFASVALLGTIFVYLFYAWVANKLNHPLANPIPFTIATNAAVLIWRGTSYETYLLVTNPLHFMLSPATVALAVPLYRQFRKIKKHARVIILAILAGSVVSTGSAVLLAMLMGAGSDSLMALSTKSVTTPIAIGVMESGGGNASLATAIVIATGILTATLGGLFLSLLKRKGAAARGLALGVSGHGIATAQAFRENETTGTYAGLAMAINGIVTAIVLVAVFAIL